MAGEQGRRLLRGRVVLPAGAEPFAGAVVTVAVEDVTYADAPARVLARRVMEGVSWEGEAAGIAFELRVPKLEERSRYALRVHVDVDGDGKVSLGDYLNMERVRVEPGAGRGEIEAPVRRVE